MRKKKAIPAPRREPEPVACSLCHRPFARSQLTRHHCKPREKGGGVEDIALLCPQCHGMVHATYTNATLARLYPTIDELRQAPELVRFPGLGKEAAAQPTQAKHVAADEDLKVHAFVLS